MEHFIQQVTNGLGTGALYVLVAIGVTLIFGVSRLINFAQGMLLLLGSYLAFTLVSLGVSFWIAVIPVTLAVGLFGMVIDRGFLRSTLDKPMNGFIVTLGLTIALEGVYTVIWGTEQRRVPSPVSGSIELLGTRLPAERLLTFGIAAVGVISLYFVLNRTDLGRCMRASAENRDAAALVGVNVGRSISWAFFLGACLAGLAGAFMATLFPFTPFSATSFVIKGLAVAVIAGLGHVWGALLVGLALGLTETLGGAYGIGAEWQNGYAYLAMALLLLWRPAGLFGGNRAY